MSDPRSFGFASRSGSRYAGTGKETREMCALAGAAWVRLEVREVRDATSLIAEEGRSERHKGPPDVPSIPETVQVQHSPGVSASHFNLCA